ncbi:MAG: PqqD family protein [Anaerolineae bacterium]|nr:PqqD family protein [Anaerolineae bacterium]
MKIDPSWTYRLKPAIAIEDFGERSLALHCVDLRLVELNAAARDIASGLDGRATLNQIALSMANGYDQPLETILPDIKATIAQLTELGFVERVYPE